MDAKRRNFLQTIFPMIATVPWMSASRGSVSRVAPSQQGQQPPQQHLPSQPAQPDTGSGTGMPHPPRHHDLSDAENTAPKLDPATILKRNQGEIETDVRKLYSLASELRDQLEKSNSTRELSVSAIADTKAIEKLAKHIRSLLTPA